MKLNPPASSSDLDAARAVARRLHRQARGHERATDEAPPATAATPSSPDGAARSAPEPPAPGTVSFGSAAVEPSPSETTAPEPPPVEETPPEEPESGLDLTDSQPVEAEAPPTEAPAAPAPWDDAPEEAAPPNEIDSDAALAALGPVEAGDALEGLEPPPGTESPEDLLGADAEPGWPEDAQPEVEIESEQEPERAPDDLVATSGTSWDDVADACLGLAQAHGTMFVDSSGQVITARGEWPEPGPEAIGGRLVSMMERTLQDAPTRSVSAPLAGQHLTAWRVPAMEGFLTVVFMGDVPLGVDVRPSIDAEITQALGE